MYPLQIASKRVELVPWVVCLPGDREQKHCTQAGFLPGQRVPSPAIIPLCFLLEVRVCWQFGSCSGEWRRGRGKLLKWVFFIVGEKVIWEESNPKSNTVILLLSSHSLMGSRTHIFKELFKNMCHAQKGLALFQVSGPLLSSDANVNICMESVVNNYMGWVSGWLMGRAILLPCPADSEVKIPLEVSQSVHWKYMVSFHLPHGFCLTLVLIIFCLCCSSRNLTVFDEVCGWPFKKVIWHQFNEDERAILTIFLFPLIFLPHSKQCDLHTLPRVGREAVGILLKVRFDFFIYVIDMIILAFPVSCGIEDQRNMETLKMLKC